MNKKKAESKHITFTPDLRADDDLANHWLHQATVRLRREVCWLWHERGATQQTPEQLSPFTDKVSASLDLTRYYEMKKRFFAEDVTAAYLSEQLNAKPSSQKKHTQGSFGWVIDELRLDDVSAFALAMALMTAFDNSAGSVIACCNNDPSKAYPNFALIQRLWEKSEEVLHLTDPLHPLFSHGLLQTSASHAQFYAEILWEQPLTVPALVARQLLFSEQTSVHGLAALKVKEKDEPELSEEARLVANILHSEKAEQLRVTPLLGATGSARDETVSAISRAAKREVYEFKGHSISLNENYLNALTTVCWLQNKDLYLKTDLSPDDDKHHQQNEGLPLTSIPVNVFLPVSERKQLSRVSKDLLLPIVTVSPLTYAERVTHWKKELGAKAKGHEAIIAEVSRRFRYEKRTIGKICQELKTLPDALKEEDFIAACRAELNLDISELAAQVKPRFYDEKLILPEKQLLQFKEQIQAMRALTQVHYEWGTARPMNESGIAVLFAGPPGTGKTMAAEIMAIELDLPMYRIDLSQVVNKYIGETEKNLKRIFDAADISDMILFFDEADALFGRRTEVSDSHDRYANLEISYLLERMERFKGLAILATNRKKDLDEAFLRRLRYIIDFPLPEESQRRQIWEQVVPAGADKSELDFDYLARQFPMTGGSIRSIVFNACLQSADGKEKRKEPERKLRMKEVMIAVKREYDKMNRAVSLEQFGPYSKDIEQLEK